MLVLVEEVLSCVEDEVGVVAFVGALFWVEVEVEGATRVEVSFIAMLFEKDGQ